MASYVLRTTYVTNGTTNTRVDQSADHGHISGQILNGAGIIQLYDGQGRLTRRTIYARCEEMDWTYEHEETERP